MNKEKSVFYHKLWKLMVPIVLQNLMLALVAVADADDFIRLTRNPRGAMLPGDFHVKYIFTGSKNTRIHAPGIQYIVPAIH